MGSPVADPLKPPRLLVVSLFLPNTLYLHTHQQNATQAFAIAANTPHHHKTNATATTTTTTTTTAAKTNTNSSKRTKDPLKTPVVYPDLASNAAQQIPRIITSSPANDKPTNEGQDANATAEGTRRRQPPRFIELPSLLDRLADKSATPSFEATNNATPFPHPVPAGEYAAAATHILTPKTERRSFVTGDHHHLNIQGAVSPAENRRVFHRELPIKPIFPASPSGVRKSEMTEPVWPVNGSTGTATGNSAGKTATAVLSGKDILGGQEANDASSLGKSESRRYRSLSRQWRDNKSGSSFHASLTQHIYSFPAGSPGLLPESHPCHSRKRRESISSSRLFANTTPSLSWTIEPSTAGNVGLQNAINSVSHGDGTSTLPTPVWVGCLNTSADMLLSDDKSRNLIEEELMTKYRSVPVWVSDAEMDGHYHQFCKQVLWPTFHYVLPDRPRGPSFEQATWKSYVAVNRKFADAVISTYRDGDIVWIHDYHLMLVPQMVREKLPDATIGFFLHIPFPSSEVFRCLHVRKQVLEGLLDADMIGFQTYPFARHFLQTCTRLLGHETTPKGIQLENTFVSLQTFPIGINSDRLNDKRQSEDVREMIASLKEKYEGVKLLIGRDKVDHIKGVRQKLLAYERFLTVHPEWVGKVVLIQIALSTTEQNELQGQVCDVAARINSQFGTLNFQPVVYLQQDISHDQYLALLSVADAFLITSLRDGMNLTSHEYVVCQADSHNPLIISEFTGTYGSFGSAALRVNPWDYREVADGILEALTMDQESKTTRWKELYEHVSTNTARHWAESFVSELTKVHGDVQRRFSNIVPVFSPKAAAEEYRNAKKRLFFLDYDGTLVPYEKTVTEKTQSAIDANSRLVRVLNRLVSDPRNVVYITSGRSRTSLVDCIGRAVPRLGLCAENGCYLKKAAGHDDVLVDENGTDSSPEWEALVPDSDNDLAWQSKVSEIFDYYTERTPGSYVERKDVTLVWHYRTCDNPTYGAWQAAEMQNHLEDSLGSIYPIHVVAGNKTLEVMPRNVNKSAAVRKVVEGLAATDGGNGADYVLSIGDDRTDEDIFECLSELRATKLSNATVTTCTVGTDKSTKASYFVTGVSAVLNSLEQLQTAGEDPAAVLASSSNSPRSSD